MQRPGLAFASLTPIVMTLRDYAVWGWQWHAMYWAPAVSDSITIWRNVAW